MWVHWFLMFSHDCTYFGQKCHKCDAVSPSVHWITSFMMWLCVISCIVDLGHLVKMFSAWFLTVKLLPTFPFEINHYIGDTWKLWKVYFSSNFHPLNQWSFVCNNYDYSVCLIVTFYFPLSFYLFIESYCQEELSFLLIYLYEYGLNIYFILEVKI